ncbi:AHH domain-containing protein [Iodobacter fluviatilis]|uniref:HNH/ENDO VII superfamily nuclease n=1 Tax=Iodobacter fluviatilis TaxID=537 RepID=A0A377Q4Y2_9NEIS|nr:AHH domain-containing protein [Iodobacter fluviatilis]TCU82642.1 HNH/ENDO VII superfamily nuclease [Iodobacter fluviatilis]STQ89872.1 Uncharacterised protein [Iodobacter fluviatilis]
MAEASETILGNIEKNTTYRKTIENNTKEATHPRNKGIIMQAHHIISADAVKRSNVGALMEQYGYDINCINNLVFLPYSLEGACHLEVQLHRGNHASPAADELLSPDDRPHPSAYHQSIRDFLDSQFRDFKDICEGDDSKVDDKFREKVNKISMKILKRIGNFDPSYQLTSIAKSFSPKNIEGCKCAANVPTHKVTTVQGCTSKRNHTGSTNIGLGQKVEIEYEKKSYELMAGK